MELLDLGVQLSLKEIEDFRKSLKNCPHCGSTEGFWLIARREKTFFQCKHCAAILEVCEVHPPSKTTKESKKFLARIKLVR
jgi:ribosomal protein L37AE/L43A